MPSHNTSSRKKTPSRGGFTLIEIVVAVAIITVILSLGLFVSLDTYRGFLSRSERDTMVSLLTRARMLAMANTHQTTWGVCYVAPNYIVFREATCVEGAAGNEETASNPGALVAGLPNVFPVVFSQLSGTTSGATITITENGRVSTITINHEGTIIW